MQGYIETRTRSGWGTFWRVLLVLWTLLFVVDVARLLFVAADASRDVNGLGSLLVGHLLTRRLVESAVIWLAGAAVLGLACYATRGTRTLVPIAPPRPDGAPPVPAAVRRPKPPPHAERFVDRLFAVAMLGVTVAIVVAMLLWR